MLRRPGLAAAGVSLLVVLVFAALAAAQSFRETARVELVRIELLALDGQGRPISGLTRANVSVRVDGKPAAVEGVEAPSTPQPRGDSPAPAAPPPEAAPAPASPPAAPLPSAGPSVYSMAFLIDETSSEASNRQAVYREIAGFLDSPLPTDVQVLFMRFDGALRVECPWTSDRDRLRRALAALARKPVVARLGTPGQMAGDGMGDAGGLRFEAMEAVARARKSLDGVFDGLRMFPDTRGRKALFVVTDGAPFLTPYEISRDLVANSQSNVSSSDPDAPRKAALEAERDSDLLLDSLSWDRTRTKSLATDVARLALVRGIEIHPLRAAAHDTSGRVTPDRAFHERADVGMGRPLSRRSQRSAESLPMTEVAAGQGMEEMAKATGGEAVLSRRFLEDGLKREVEERHAAYAVTFRDPFPGDHRFHKVEISVAGIHADLRYRRGYRILDVQEALTEASVDRLYAAADRNPLGVRLQVDSLGTEGGRAIAEITVAYPAPPAAPGGYESGSTMHAIGVCAVKNGALSQPIDLGGPVEKSRVGETLWLVRTGRLRLKPGAYRCSFAIRDDPTEVTSYLAFERALP